MAVAAMCGYSLRMSAQQLKAENIDEVVNAMTLEEKYGPVKMFQFVKYFFRNLARKLIFQ